MPEIIVFLIIAEPKPRVCLKIAFRQLCVPLCGRFGPDEGGVAGYVDRIGGQIYRKVYFAVMYPCAVSNSAQRIAPPAAPRTVLWESPTNL